MVYCFAADCGYTSESHHCRYFFLQRIKYIVQNMGFDVQRPMPYVCMAHPASDSSAAFAKREPVAMDTSRAWNDTMTMTANSEKHLGSLYKTLIKQNKLCEEYVSFEVIIRILEQHAHMSLTPGAFEAKKNYLLKLKLLKIGNLRI